LVHENMSENIALIEGQDTRAHNPRKHFDQELLRRLEMIHQDADKVDHAVNSLESLAEINHNVSIWPRKTRVIDLKQNLETRVEAHLEDSDKHSS